MDPRLLHLESFFVSVSSFFWSLFVCPSFVCLPSYVFCWFLTCELPSPFSLPSWKKGEIWNWKMSDLLCLSLSPLSQNCSVGDKSCSQKYRHIFVHTCIFVCYTLSFVAIYMCPILTFIREQPQWKTHTFVNIFIGKDIPMHPCYQLKFQPPQTFDFHTRTSLLFKGHTRETQLWSQICFLVYFGKTLHWFNGKCWCFSFRWWNFAFGISPFSRFYFLFLLKLSLNLVFFSTLWKEGFNIICS